VLIFVIQPNFIVKRRPYIDNLHKINCPYFNMADNKVWSRHTNQQATHLKKDVGLLSGGIFSVKGIWLTIFYEKYIV
jgi:hypothetical protein